MTFYTSASFFILLAALIVPAAAFGVWGRGLKCWGMAASAIMLAFLYSSSAVQAAAFGLFVAIATAGAFATLASWKRGAKSMAVYRISLACTLAPLVIYKVSAVFDQNLLAFAGISYVTFKAVQVLIEIRDGLIDDMRVRDYLYFLTFFATITSGSIDRSRRFMDDLKHQPSRSDYLELLSRGLLLLLVGAAFQLVFASIALHYYAPDRSLVVPSIAYGVARQIANAYLYALYLFFDFAGYSLMAMGASYCFGIVTPRNFQAPFAAVDMKDFWNRWHITLSTWLRDFVFMRFVRWATRRRVFSSRLSCACTAYVVDMAIMGAWHGLTPDYLAYGLYHGGLLAATEAYQKRSSFHKRHKQARWYRVLSWFVTMQLVIFGFALFSGQLRTIVERIING
ncbi:D-alanyl-lipoteichoic acid biosynthesis protein DltB [Collinsella sp. D33t1_170424_A12]|uniref:D-alanyl-lipoteichoic acid biosynthesis protein DltB n=1 Tax=Collinsella sp. D33t1_170424_A12 TaxID=2787135 RepID=UPI001896FEA6|nr:D-alanyl-lipoteichoic acid biosynthesis protein DltB [Collinsella sp. D33t1_170424_A12]